MRHAMYMAQAGGASARALIAPYAVANGASILANDYCTSGRYGIAWQGPCNAAAVQDTITFSAAVDAILAAAVLSPGPAPAAWTPLGLGGCVDNANASMPSCYKAGVIGEPACAAVATNDPASVAYEFEIDCKGGAGLCRVHTTGGVAACAAGYSYQIGTASSVTTTTGASLNVCVVRS